MLTANRRTSTRYAERRLKMVSLVLDQEVPPTSADGAKNPIISSYRQLRLYVGLIGVLLPLVLVVANWVDGDGVQPSMSGYYYTPMRNIFIGALWAIGVFLVAYNGYDRADGIITNIAGGSTIAISLFPTTPNNPAVHQVVLGDLHLAFACVSFVMLAVMALRFANYEATPGGLPFGRRLGYAFGLTREATAGTPRWAVITYRVCAVTILVCIALVYPGSRVFEYSLLILEWILLTAFGVSWFIKGSRGLSPLADGL
jgi:hypothetical protein